MMHDVGRCVPGVTKKIWAVITGNPVRPQQIRKSMKSSSQEAFLIDVRKRAHGAAVADSQKIKVVGVLAILREKRDGVQTRTVVVQLALQLAKLAGKNEVPIAPCAAVVSPMWNGGIVAKYGVERHVGFLLKAKMLHPGVDLFLPGRVPRHFAPKRIGFLFPTICPH